MDGWVALTLAACLNFGVVLECMNNVRRGRWDLDLALLLVNPYLAALQRDCSFLASMVFWRMILEMGLWLGTCQRLYVDWNTACTVYDHLSWNGKQDHPIQ